MSRLQGWQHDLLQELLHEWLELLLLLQWWLQEWRDVERCCTMMHVVALHRTCVHRLDVYLA